MSMNKIELKRWDLKKTDPNTYIQAIWIEMDCYLIHCFHLLLYTIIYLKMVIYTIEINISKLNTFNLNLLEFILLTFDLKVIWLLWIWSPLELDYQANNSLLQMAESGSHAYCEGHTSILLKKSIGSCTY